MSFTQVFFFIIQPYSFLAVWSDILYSTSSEKCLQISSCMMLLMAIATFPWSLGFHAVRGGEIWFSGRRTGTTHHARIQITWVVTRKVLQSRLVLISHNIKVRTLCKEFLIRSWRSMRMAWSCVCGVYFHSPFTHSWIWHKILVDERAVVVFLPWHHVTDFSSDLWFLKKKPFSSFFFIAHFPFWVHVA